jgi:hypothetical protein
MVQAQTQMDVSVRLQLEAVHRAAHRPAAIDEAQPTRQVHACERWTELALTRDNLEFQKWDLDEVVSREQ